VKVNVKFIKLVRVIELFDNSRICFEGTTYMTGEPAVLSLRIFRLTFISHLHDLISGFNNPWSCTSNHPQCDKNVSVHLMITIQKATSNVQSVPRQSPDIYGYAERQDQGDTRLSLTSSVIPNSNYVIMVSG
jgi:hypothetical protein